MERRKGDGHQNLTGEVMFEERLEEGRVREDAGEYRLGTEWEKGKAVGLVEGLEARELEWEQWPCLEQRAPAAL